MVIDMADTLVFVGKAVVAVLNMVLARGRDKAAEQGMVDRLELELQLDKVVAPGLGLQPDKAAAQVHGIAEPVLVLEHSPFVVHNSLLSCIVADRPLVVDYIVVVEICLDLSPFFFNSNLSFF